MKRRDLFCLCMLAPLSCSSKAEPEAGREAPVVAGLALDQPIDPAFKGCTA